MTDCINRDLGPEAQGSFDAATITTTHVVKGLVLVCSAIHALIPPDTPADAA